MHPNIDDALMALWGADTACENDLEQVAGDSTGISAIPRQLPLLVTESLTVGAAGGVQYAMR